MYLTVERYRTMRYGTDLEHDDIDLASVMERARTLVDAYCAAPMRPARHDFRGGTITGEEQRWRVPEAPYVNAQRRFYPFHTPITSIEQFRIYITNTQYVEIAPSEFFINNTERYIELISLALSAYGIFGSLVIPNLGLTTPVARVNYTYGYDFTATDEPIYATDGLTFRSQNNWWKTSPTPVVKVNGATQSSGYSIDYSEGTVIFDSAPTKGATVTVTYNYKLPPEIRDASGYIATHILEESHVIARGLHGISRLTVAEVTIQKETETPSTAREYIKARVPEAAILLDDFGFWRASA